MIKKLLTLLLAFGMTLGAAGCELLGGGGNSASESVSESVEESASASESAPEEEQPTITDPVDYVANLKLDMESTATKKMEVDVRAFIDGDTTHFNTTPGFNAQDILKARYLAVNTPESTGQIEEWGKKASNFTRTALSSADSIIVETDGADWEVDSTGERYLVWVWYRPAGESDYRNLNLELLQNGLAVGSKASSTRYGEICSQAIYQASVLKLHVFSNEKDPDFYYGTAIELDLKELRTNIDTYNGLRVAFEGYVSYYSSQGVYIENYDSASDMWYGIYAYYGYNPASAIPEIMAVGNKVRVVGSVSYWEQGGTYQVSDLRYNAFNKKDPENVQRLDDVKYTTANVETTAETFLGKVTVDTEEANGETVSKEFDYAELAINTSLTMKNLKVTRVSTTNNGGDSDGAMSLTCEAPNGQTISVRTVVLYDENGDMITANQLSGKTIDVTGIIDFYSTSGKYQVKVFNWKNIVIH